jgi:transposase InsO family protein
VKFDFIRAEKANHSVRRMCRVLKVSPSGYYAWMARPASKRQRRDQVLLTHIRAAQQASRGTYGSPRVHAELQGQGFETGRKRIARLMRSPGRFFGGILMSSPARCTRTVLRSERTRTVRPEIREGDRVQRPLHLDGMIGVDLRLAAVRSSFLGRVDVPSDGLAVDPALAGTLPLPLPRLPQAEHLFHFDHGQLP